MKDAIRFQVMPDDVMSRGRMETFARMDREHAAFNAEADRVSARYVDRRDFEIKRSTHEIHEFRLALQVILVAYDPETSTLYVAERSERGYVFEAAERAHERGERNPYLNEVWFSKGQASMANAARAKHAKAVGDAVERLKSRKPGIRRRAKRLLTKLGKQGTR